MTCLKKWKVPFFCFQLSRSCRRNLTLPFFRRILSLWNRWPVSLMRKNLYYQCYWLITVEKSSYGRYFLKCCSPCPIFTECFASVLFKPIYPKHTPVQTGAKNCYPEQSSPSKTIFWSLSVFMSLSGGWLSPGFWSLQVFRYFSFSNTLCAKPVPLGHFFSACSTYDQFPWSCLWLSSISQQCLSEV